MVISMVYCRKISRVDTGKFMRTHSDSLSKNEKHQLHVLYKTTKYLSILL